tara:strand:- start:258 stop:455 length:198 start_codon:yes stop_codon:yes gene_type:complete
MSTILEQWNEIKTLVESLDLDVSKNADGNSSAGVRARRGLRLLKSKSTELVKATIEADKARKESK